MAESNLKISSYSSVFDPNFLIRDFLFKKSSYTKLGAQSDYKYRNS